MITSIKEILGSVRFWFVTISALIAILSFYGVVPDEVRNIIIAWLGTVTGIGTLDKVAGKIGGNQF